MEVTGHVAVGAGQALPRMREVSLGCDAGQENVLWGLLSRS